MTNMRHTALAMRPLDGKLALVTGSSRGIGRDVAIKLAQDGAAVMVHHLEDQDSAAETLAAVLEAAAPEVRQACDVVEADIAERASVKALLARVHDRLGGLDILVNNAGFGARANFLDIDEDLWEHTINVNLGGTFRVSQSAAREMIPRGGGAIVNISSVSSTVGTVDQVHYSASKAGINGLTIGMAVALGPHGVRVNAVMPGGVATEMNRPANMGLPEWVSLSESLRPGSPIDRYGKPSDVASAVAFLVSDAASWITGALIPVDGGYGVMPRAVRALKDFEREDP